MLTAWPITEDERALYRFDGGDASGFCNEALSSLQPLAPVGDERPRAVPEILDPYVMYAFVAVVLGEYTPSGTPFGGNWRFLPNGRRMAERLGATALAEEVARVEAELGGWDALVLDAWQGDAPREVLESQPDGTEERLFDLLDARFVDLAERGDCSYGSSAKSAQGAERLMAALADWVTDAFPIDVLPDREAVKARLDEARAAALETDPLFYRRWAADQIGDTGLSLMEGAGLRLERSIRLDPNRDPDAAPFVFTTFFEAKGGRRLMALNFEDAVLMVDCESLEELSRMPQTRPPLKRHDRLVLKASERPDLTFDAEALRVTRADPGAPVKTLTYLH